MKLSPYVPRWNIYGQINDGYKPRSVAYAPKVRLSRGTITVPRKGRPDEFLRRSFMIYRPDKINLTPHHLHLPTYALYIRRTRLGTTIPGVTVPP